MDKQQTILIVDDQAINRKILKRLLSDQYGVIEATNGNEAWDILKSATKNVTAVLLDIVMPDLDGYGFLKRVQDAGLSGLPIIVMTGEADSQVEQKALDAGAWDFITKPFKAPVLNSRLSNAIARSQVAVAERMQYMSEHDSLTGQYNRERLFRAAHELMIEDPTKTYAFFRIDIDHFSLYNAAFGEAEGNRLIQFLGEVIKKKVCQYPRHVYGRMNADIFFVCLPYSGSLRCMERDIAECQAQIAGFSQNYRLETSVGVCLVTDPFMNIEDCYQHAALGAQSIKDQYGVNIGHYNASMSNRLAQELEITNDMQHALETNQFVVYLQPKVELTTDEPAGAEALVRWIHPEKGLVSPGDFIPVFERNGFVAKVDYYVWEQTCKMLRAWQDAGGTVNPISVNISRISLYNPKLVDLFTGLVEKYGIDPALLQLEVTESAYMTNPDQMSDTIHALREAGFSILVDDFGSGYSSLNTLKTMEVDILKIDMKFLPIGNETERGEIILASIIRMANWLGMPTIAEGVETRRQRDFLEGAGCDYVQGYYYSRPIPQDEYEKDYVFKSGGTPTQDSSSMQVTQPRHNITILVVDDSPMSQQILTSYFDTEYHVQAVDSGEEALLYLKRYKEKVKLILVDNVMPGMSGIEFLRHCQQSNGSLRAIPKIMITGADNIQDQVAAFRNGAYDYITKPLNRDIVEARVAHVMNISYQLRQAAVSGMLGDGIEQDTDDQTGLLTKHAFRRRTMIEMENNTNEYHAMMMLDVDGFKAINAEHGLDVGDEVLKIIANELKRNFRRTDILGRFGSDEFLVLMTGISDHSFSMDKANDVSKAIILACFNKLHIEMSISIGIAGGHHNDYYDTLFARADQALHVAKSHGGNALVNYDEM